MVILSAAILSGAVLVGNASRSAAVDRSADPVVLTGAEVSALTGVAPGDLVAFRYASGWEQIPVQVDERAMINFDDVYNHQGTFGGGVSVLGYTDAGTFTGPDPDATLDADDEMVFMAKDTGERPTTFGEPQGIVSSSGVEVVISDPLGTDPSYVYLFRQDGSLDPAAGQQYVSYQFNLLSGDYLNTYQILSGPNPEDSVITSSYYERHFADRWIQDGLRIFAGVATGVDILDRHKSLFAPGVCARSEDTFSNGEGAFVVNKSGPVRALRSYVGANSGPLTQRTHYYYERREDIATDLRVHAISGIMDFFDYSSVANGMTYHNNHNPTGVTIDGTPDAVTAGAIEWELVAGPQGSLIMTGGVETDIAGLAPTSYYLDDANPADTQCTGDAFAYGSSGVWISQGLPNTDPRNPPANILRAMRVMYYEPPGATVADAEDRRDALASPLDLATEPWAAKNHDSVVISRRPVTVRLQRGQTSVIRNMLVRVRNADILPAPERPGHNIRLVGEDGDCPAGTISRLPDFEPGRPGEQDVVFLPGGRAKAARVRLDIKHAAFTSISRRAPTRCTLRFTASTELPDNADPTPANNVLNVELNVLDRNDPEADVVHESFVESVRRERITLRHGQTDVTRTAALWVGNADVVPVPEVGGDDITVTASDGDCPNGTVGVPDMDPSDPGTQNTVTVPAGRRKPGKLPLSISAAAFTARNAKSPARCVAEVTVAGLDGDDDTTNNTTKLVIDVIDPDDFPE